MPLHKSIQPGDVVLKLKIPISIYPLLKMNRVSQDFRFSDIFSSHSHPSHTRYTPYSNIQDGLRIASYIQHHEKLESPTPLNERQLKNSRQMIERGYAPWFSERIEEYIKDPFLMFRDVHPTQHSGEYLHFLLIVNSRRARTRGERLPSFFKPFLDKIGVSYITHQRHSFNYNYFHMHAFNVLNPLAKLETKLQHLSDFRNQRTLSTMYASPLKDLSMNKLHSFMPDDVEKPYITSSADTFVAPGLSLNLVDPEIYEQVPVNPFAQQILSDMPDSFKAAINYIQQSGYNMQADSNFIQLVLKSRISREGRSLYFNGNFYDIPANLHLGEESVRREALVHMSKYHVHETQHSLSLLHPLFNFFAYPIFMLKPIQMIPKNSLPAIELTFH